MNLQIYNFVKLLLNAKMEDKERKDKDDKYDKDIEILRLKHRIEILTLKNILYKQIITHNTNYNLKSEILSEDNDNIESINRISISFNDKNLVLDCPGNTGNYTDAYSKIKSTLSIEPVEKKAKIKVVKEKKKSVKYNTEIEPEFEISSDEQLPTPITVPVSVPLQSPEYTAEMIAIEYNYYNWKDVVNLHSDNAAKIFDIFIPQINNNYE